MTAHHDKSIRFSPNADEDFEIRSAIGLGTGIGEILAATKVCAEATTKDGSPRGTTSPNASLADAAARPGIG
jgi:hypothetical protein